MLFWKSKEVCGNSRIERRTGIDHLEFYTYENVNEFKKFGNRTSGLIVDVKSVGFLLPELSGSSG